MAQNKYKWSYPTLPNNDSFYDHITLQSPLGLIIIEWKSWKELPSYDITNKTTGEWLGCEYDLRGAQNKVNELITNKFTELKIFIESLKVDPYYLDRHIEGYWLIRSRMETFTAGYNREKVVSLIEKLNKAHRPNIEQISLHEIQICWNEHHRSGDCELELQDLDKQESK